jgi:hypothetical protein
MPIRDRLFQMIFVLGITALITLMLVNLFLVAWLSAQVQIDYRTGIGYVVTIENLNVTNMYVKTIVT